MPLSADALHVNRSTCADQIEAGTHDSSWTFASAVAAGRQIVTAPATAIAAYLWPCAQQPRTGADGGAGRITNGVPGAIGPGSGATLVCEVTDEGAGSSRMHAPIGDDPGVVGAAAAGSTGARGAALGALGVRGWAAQPPEVSEATGARASFGGGGVVRSSTRMPAALSGVTTDQPGVGVGGVGSGRVRFDSAADTPGEGRWEDVGQAQSTADGPAVRRIRPIFSSK